MATTERWMKGCGFYWTMARKGPVCWWPWTRGCSHLLSDWLPSWEDIVKYHQTGFLHEWYTLELSVQSFKVVKGELVKEPPQAAGRCTQVIWFHDELTFYANNWCKKCWIHVNEMPTPQPKGEGPSLMMADFVSADYEWLRSPEGTESARILFCAGKGHDGYFSNDKAIHHVEKVMVILEKHYQDEDHVFIFDNAPTHTKQANDSLSVQNMPKGCKEWGVDVPVWDQHGQVVLGSNEKAQMIKAWIANGFFKDGIPQEFYWPEGHQHAGKFKGMAQILMEQGFDVAHLKVQCKQCKLSATTCCCHRILFNQPDFINVETILEFACKVRGFQVIFLPKFHCELNFIEQCWGYAKWNYCCYPPSSKESDIGLSTTG